MKDFHQHNHQSLATMKMRTPERKELKPLIHEDFKIPEVDDRHHHKSLLDPKADDRHHHKSLLDPKADDRHHHKSLLDPKTDDRHHHKSLLDPKADDRHHHKSLLDPKADDRDHHKLSLLDSNFIPLISESSAAHLKPESVISQEGSVSRTTEPHRSRRSEARRRRVSRAPPDTTVVSTEARARWRKSIAYTTQRTRFKSTGEAKELFKRGVRKVMLILGWKTALSGTSGWENELKSFMDLVRSLKNMANHNSIEERSGLSFDPKEFRAKKEMSVTKEVQHTLTLPSAARTPDMLHKVIHGLQSLRSFAEYPLHMQEKLAKVAWYQEMDAGRLVLREGHYPENFYFILSGQAFVKKIVKNEVTGRMQMAVLGRMKRGQSFGELALLHYTKRSASVETETDMKLLTVSREDFFDIFLNNKNGEEPDHIKFCRTIPWLREWPLHLVGDHPGCIMFHYFRRGVVVVEKSEKNEWIYIVKSGTCSALKRLSPVKATRMWVKTRISTSAPLPRMGTADPGPRVDTGITRKKNMAAISLPGLCDIKTSPSRISFNLTEVEAPDDDDDDEAPPTTHPRPPAWRQPQSKPATESQETRQTRSLLPSVCQDTIKAQQVHPELALLYCTDPRGPGHSHSKTGFLPQLAAPHRKAAMAEESPAHDRTLNTQKQSRPHKPKDTSEDLPCFVRIKTLRIGDAFGLEEVEFEDEPIEKSDVSISLVSHGAELIMLSRKFFIKFANEHVQRHIREHVRQYPTEEKLQENLQTEANWELFRNDVVSDVVVQSKTTTDKEVKMHVFR